MKKFDMKKKKSVVERNQIVAAVKEIVAEKIAEKNKLPVKKEKKVAIKYIGYMNHGERQFWLQMIYLGQAIDRLIDGKVYYGKARTNLKKAKTWLLKSIDELTLIYPKQIHTILNDVEYFDMIMHPKSDSRKHYDKMISRELLAAMEDPIEQLYEVLDTTLPLTCGGCCKIGAECQLKSIFDRYNIPPMDEHDKLCSFRYAGKE